MFLLQLQLILGVLVINIVQLALLLEELKLQLFGFRCIATENFFDLSEVLLGHFLAKELVDLRQECSIVVLG